MPHVLGIRANQKFLVTNSDPTAHNVNVQGKGNPPWNTSQPPNAPAIEQKFVRAEVIIPVKCNQHPWMKSYIGVLPHGTFQREGDSIYMQLPVSFVKATLGADANVKTLNGSVDMKIPAGTQSGKVFRVKAKGMPDVHGRGQGDLYVRVMIEVPTKLTTEQRNLLEEFARISGETEPNSGSFKERMKKVFK